MPVYKMMLEMVPVYCLLAMVVAEMVVLLLQLLEMMKEMPLPAVIALATC